MAVRILVGDALERLGELPDESVHSVVTSPPYWALRTYGGDPGMIGLEPTFDEHLDNLMRVFAEIWRVLRADGTFWLNYGDAYAYGVPGGGSPDGARRGRADTAEAFGALGGGARGIGLRPKNLMLMPARVVLAVQAAGWYVRSEIVWAKPNPMPESCVDRPTCAHEKIFLLAKRPRYFYDALAVRTPARASTYARLNQRTFDQQTGGPKDSGDGNRSHRRVLDNLAARHRERSVPSSWASSDSYVGQDPRAPTRDKRRNPEGDAKPDEQHEPAMGANLRNVWHVAAGSYAGAHFATFPPALVEPMIRAGTSEAGACGACGAPIVRETVKTATGRSRPRSSAGVGLAHSREPRGLDAVDGTFREGVRHAHAGWRRSCDHDEAEIVPAVVLDPFGGAGTVGLVADRLNRDAILVEISDEYARLAADRIRGDAPMFADVRVEASA